MTETGQETLCVTPGRLTLADLARVATHEVGVSLDPACLFAIAASRAAVDASARSGVPAYGINTGFGKLARTHIPDHQLDELQTNLVRSHAVGIGSPLAPAVLRVILILKAASLARGHSGVRQAVIDTLFALYEHDILPVIPSQGSVGASGDLAPLAHLTLALIGEGEVFVDGVRKPAGRALSDAGIAPLSLGAKEGLALLNGTQVSTALALVALFEAESICAAAIVTGALSVDAARGSDAPFDERIHAVRGQPGQIAAARCMRALLEGSAIRQSHLENDDRVQDPYSLRCQPQVMGAVVDTLAHVARVLETEANAVTDNPLTFGAEILSGGNFHAEPVALAADMLALALAETGALSERRIALLIDASLSGLPAFLVANAGLNSGFMIAHVTAAALASENKSLAHPASVDSLPTSANQEDHVSMATFAARRLFAMTHNVRHILGIELLAAAQGVDFHRPLRSSAALESVHALVRAAAPFYDRDRILAPEMERAAELVGSGHLTSALSSDWPGLQRLSSFR